MARIGRLRLAQSALTMVWSVVLFDEHVDAVTVVAAALVVGLAVAGSTAGAVHHDPAIAAVDGSGEVAVTAGVPTGVGGVGGVGGAR